MPSKQNISPQKQDLEQNLPQASLNQDFFGWTVPLEQIPLPTAGILYPKENPLHNKESLQIKAMTAQEEDIIMSRALLKEGTIVSHLIKSCLIDKSINPDDLLVGDRNSLLVAIRITGYGSKYDATVSCPDCSVSQTQSFDLADLEILRLKLSPIAPGKNEFEFNLPVTKKRVTFKFLTIANENENSITAERRQRLMPDMKVEGVITNKLENQIVSIEGVYDRNKISGFIKAMPAGDSKALRTHISNHEPGIDMNASMKCTSCSTISKIGLPLGATFFWPK